MKYPKSFYQVFRADKDVWDTIGDPLFESDCLAKTITYAYNEYKKDGQRYTVIQPYDGSCRDAYGFPSED
jgi:hypothetical protein